MYIFSIPINYPHPLIIVQPSRSSQSSQMEWLWVGVWMFACFPPLYIYLPLISLRVYGKQVFLLLRGWIKLYKLNCVSLKNTIACCASFSFRRFSTIHIYFLLLFELFLPVLLLFVEMWISIQNPNALPVLNITVKRRNSKAKHTQTMMMMMMMSKIVEEEKNYDNFIVYYCALPL